MPPSDRYIANTEFYVRYAETDAMGIVHHASYIIWLEESRSSYIRSRGYDYVEVERAGYFLSVVELKVRYRAPARYGDLIRVACWVESLASRAITFEYEVSHATTGALFVTGESRHIATNKAGQPTLIPENFRQYLTPG
jgi:acyl-CoA thioester hydrolase